MIYGDFNASEKEILESLLTEEEKDLLESLLSRMLAKASEWMDNH